MQQSSDLHFVSSNSHKYREAKEILKSFGVTAGFFKCSLEEIQSDSLKEIAEHKARNAFSKCKRPVIVEDDGLFIDSLHGFPGPYSSYVFETIGNKGILDLVKNNKRAKFVSVITYCDRDTLKSFDARVCGRISTIQRGRGWGYDPIFLPGNSRKTFAESANKDQLSHRYNALKKFSNWYLRRRMDQGGRTRRVRT